MGRAVKVAVPSLLGVAGVTLAVSFLGGGDESRSEIALRYRSELKAVGEDLRAVGAAMPPGRVDESECPGLEPGQRPFRYHRLERQPDNVVFVMEGDLAGRAREPGRLDPVGSQLPELVSIAETGSPEGEAEWYAQQAPDGYAEHVEELARTRYVAVVRVTDLQAPEVTDDVRGGYMAMELVLADLRTHAILCTTTAEAGAGEALYRSSEGDSPAERRRLAQGALESELLTAAEDALERALNDLGRGDFSGL